MAWDPKKGLDVSLSTFGFDISGSGGKSVSAFATSIKNAYLISKEKKILSYAKLQKQNPKIVANNYLTTTDIFDIELMSY